MHCKHPSKILYVVFLLTSELNAQADLWSVGAILYQLVTGKTPFTGNNQIQVCHLFHYLFPSSWEIWSGMAWVLWTGIFQAFNVTSHPQPFTQIGIFTSFIILILGFNFIPHILCSCSRTLWNQLNWIPFQIAVIWVMCAKIYAKNCCVGILVCYAI